ncbi:MAG TPA: hypothetical protein VET65_05035 [Candidatus Limnocylindrales bacterium]|nr:hypothetical protein [Candidatus Limnocylindrales bacterium]
MKVLVAIVLALLAACSPAVGAGQAEKSVVVRTLPAVAEATPSPPAALPALAAPPVVAQPAIREGTFPLVPVGMRGAMGSVTVTAQGGGFSLSVSARHLAPLSLHTVHLHLGSCASAYVGRHLLVIGSVAANGGGVGSVSANLGFPYTTGRYVIVYANANAVTIIGCADLGGL